MLAAHQHPEFGYLCPSPALRRVFQAVLVVSLIALVAGANSFGALVGDQDAEGTIASAPARPAEAAAEMALVSIVPTGVAAGSAVKVDAIGSATPAARGAERAAADRSANAPGPLVSIQAAGASNAEARAIGCGQNVEAYPAGKCEAGKMRRVRLPQKDPPPAPDGAGRGASTADRARSTATGTPPNSNQQVRPPVAPAAAPTTAQIVPAEQPVAVAKRPRRVADVHGRQRDSLPSTAQSRPNSPNFNQNPFAALFGGFR